MKRPIALLGLGACVLAGLAVSEVLALPTKAPPPPSTAARLPYPVAPAAGFVCDARVVLPGNCDRSCCDFFSGCCLETHNGTAGVKYQTSPSPADCTEDQVSCSCGFTCKCISRCGFGATVERRISSDVDITGQQTELCGTVGNARDCDIECVCPGTTNKCRTTSWVCSPA
jgi:hypothetical protein